MYGAGYYMGPRSGGAAIAAGLTSGVKLGQELQDQQNQQEDRGLRLQQNAQDRDFLQQQRTRKLQDQDYDSATQALDAQMASLRAEGQGYAQQYGGNVPPEIAGPYQQRVQQLTGIRNDLLQKRYAPLIQQRQKQMQDVVSQLQTDPNAVSSVSPTDLYSALTTAARRDPQDLLDGPDGQPSKVSQAVTSLTNGIQTGNQDMMLQGANTLLEPELKTGVGQPSPHGGTIVGKRIVSFVPHPNDPSQFTPVLRVYVNDGTQNSASTVNNMDRIRQQDPNAPDGATGYYMAPVTQNRSTDPTDNVASISLDKAMNYAGQLQTLSTVISQHPELRDKIEQGAKQDGGQSSSFLSALYSVGGQMPTKKVAVHDVAPGHTLVGLDTTTGQQVSSVSGPPAPAPTTGLAGQLSQIHDQAQQDGISDQAEAQKMQRMGLLRTPAAPKAAPGDPGAGGLISPDNSNLSGDDFLKTLPPSVANTVRALDEGRIQITSLSTRSGEREKYLNLLMQYNPQSNTQAAKVQQQTENKFATGTQGNAVRSFNTAVAHLDSLSSLADAMNNGDVQLINKAKNAVAAAFGNPAATNFDAAKKIVTDEVVKAIVGAGGGVQDRDEAANIMSNAKSPAQLKGAIAQIHDLMGGQLRGLAQQYYAGGGSKDFGQTFLTPRALQLAGALPSPPRRGLAGPGAGAASAPAPAAAPAPAPGPTQLPSDPQAATQAFANMPSGTIFIDPNGVRRRKP